jgi:hypothetical protein
MKKDSMVIDGKTYISARRASEIAAYSKDYVGQLCREGRLDCRRVNRLWWVEEGSIRKHAAETVKANHTSFRSVSEPVRFVPVQPTQTAKQTFGRQISHIRSDRRFVSVSGFAIVLCLVFVTTLASIPVWKTISPDSLKATASAYLNGLQEQTLASRAWSSIASIFSGHQSQTFFGNLAVDDGKSGDIADSSSVAHAGLVVVPSQGSTTDEKMAQTISNSFSDDVTVAPNANGTTGVITPVFRTIKGHDYLYVLVPVKTASTTGN